MPTYDYQCTRCGKKFEFFQRMSDDPLTTCPQDQCGEVPWAHGEVQRLIGAGAGLIFNGSGFYLTDYRNSSSSPSSAKEHSPASASSQTSSESTSTGSSAASSSSESVA